tara:strand:+ start:1468 stop:2559 length:1092 start_codon:yes stop_codon:yes gene_type:complete
MQYRLLLDKYNKVYLYIMGDEQLIENVRLAIVVDEVLSKKEEVEIDETVLSETFFTPVKKSTKLSEPDFNDLNALNKKLTDGLDKEIEVECEEDTLYVNIDYDKGNYSNFLEKAKEVLLLLGEHGVCVAQVVSHTMKQFYCKYKLSEKFSDYNLCLKCTIPKDERNSDYQHFYANIYFGTKESNEQLRKDKDKKKYKDEAKTYVNENPLFEVTKGTREQVDHIIDQYPYKFIEKGLEYMKQEDGKMKKIKTLEELQPLLNRKIHEPIFKRKLIDEIALLKEEKDVDALYDDDQQSRHKRIFEDYKNKEDDKELFDSINQGINKINNKNHYRSKYDIKQIPTIQRAKIVTITTKCDIDDILENI